MFTVIFRIFFGVFSHFCDICAKPPFITVKEESSETRGLWFRSETDAHGFE